MTDRFEKLGPFGKDMEQVSQAYFSRLSPRKKRDFLRRELEAGLWIKEERVKNERPRPSAKLFSLGETPARAVRNVVLDVAAEFTDRYARSSEGRGKQGPLFAAFARAVLETQGIVAEIVIGWARYLTPEQKPFEWDYAWLETEFEVIDGNADAMIENPMVPENLIRSPYWGPRERVLERQLTRIRTVTLEREALEIHPDLPQLRLEAQEHARSLLKPLT